MFPEFPYPLGPKRPPISLTVAFRKSWFWCKSVKANNTLHSGPHGARDAALPAPDVPAPTTQHLHVWPSVGSLSAQALCYLGTQVEKSLECSSPLSGGPSQQVDEHPAPTGPSPGCAPPEARREGMGCQGHPADQGLLPGSPSTPL